MFLMNDISINQGRGWEGVGVGGTGVFPSQLVCRASSTGCNSSHLLPEVVLDVTRESREDGATRDDILTGEDDDCHRYSHVVVIRTVHPTVCRRESHCDQCTHQICT